MLSGAGSGSYSGIVDGIDWVIGTHAKYPGTPGIINMSLGGGYTSIFNTALAASKAAGIINVVAAGNDNRDACSYSPAGNTGSFSVGASDINDVRSYFSNYGSCVDIFAPGS